MLRYRPVRGVIARVGAHTPASDIAALRAAAAVAGVALTVSGPGGDTVEDDAELAARIGRRGVERLRLLTAVDDAVLVACHEAGVAVDTTAVTGDGRIELPCWLREQAISRTRHRHGRIPNG